MANQLANQNSPYLLQHAENPVDWYPWGPEALEKARSEDKPIFLSIGYAACHWCHVMAHESFEDPETAALMNDSFVNIKVDREERPDLDSIYMQAVTALTGSGGWPMSVFLTPAGVPFLGGTYFPPVRRYNMPSFREILRGVAHAWENDRPRLLDNGQQLLEHIKAQVLPTPKAALDPQALDQAAAALANPYDWKNGGWGRAPKFPQPMAIEFLLRKATRGDAFAREIAVHALKAMARGGMYDVVGGGFARYSTDDRWLVPHFEKMLYDNAQLAQVYLHGWLVTGENRFRQICEETLDFVMREMTHPLGGFYASLDADSEGHEGRFYVWTLDELRTTLSPDDYELFLAAYDVSETGNFEGQNVLQRRQDDSTIAKQHHITPEEVAAALKRIHTHLLAVRSRRPRPATDDKILTAWNALMLTAFAEAARYLKSASYLQAAIRNADFLLANLFSHPHSPSLEEAARRSPKEDGMDGILKDAGSLQRSWREGQARHLAYLEDYAALALALLALYQSDPNPRWYRVAKALADEVIAHFADESGGFFDTRDDHEALITRPKDLQDNATPCGNALAALALLKLAAYTGESEYRQRAETSLGMLQSSMIRYPTAFSFWLCAEDFAIGPVQEVVIAGEIDSTAGQALRQALWAVYRPRVVAAFVDGSASSAHPPLTTGRTARDHQPTAYVCQDFVCQRPVHTPEQLNAQLQV
ncbi:MAG: thioredoxin domain-containing protein [Chloroflexota bacterium]